MISICHFANLLTGKADGVFTHLKLIFQTLDKKKYRHILVFQGAENVEIQLLQLGVKYYKVESLKKKFSIKTFFEISRIIKNENPDILHVHMLKSYAIVGLLNIFHHRKLIFNYHGLFINNIYNSFLEKIIYKSAHQLINLFDAVDYVIVPSEYSKNLLLQETKIFREIKVYYNGYLPHKDVTIVESITQELENLKKNFKLIGILARIESQKRIDRALEVLKNLLLDKVNVYFVFMGDGPLEEQMVDKAIDQRVDDHCRFYGYMENAQSYLKYFDLLLLTSDWEGMPLVIWEAMANGVPIVSSDVGGVKEILESAHCGVVYDKDDVPTAVNILKNLINKPDKLKAMGYNGKVAIKEKYTLQNFSNTIDDFYTKLIEN
jgi:glycosyltransferase involved in cell wall biosynthesis